VAIQSDLLDQRLIQLKVLCVGNNDYPAPRFPPISPVDRKNRIQLLNPRHFLRRIDKTRFETVAGDALPGRGVEVEGGLDGVDVVVHVAAEIGRIVAVDRNFRPGSDHPARPIHAPREAHLPDARRIRAGFLSAAVGLAKRVFRRKNLASSAVDRRILGFSRLVLSGETPENRPLPSFSSLSVTVVIGPDTCRPVPKLCAGS